MIPNNEINKPKKRKNVKRTLFTMEVGEKQLWPREDYISLRHANWELKIQYKRVHTFQILEDDILVVREA